MFSSVHTLPSRLLFLFFLGGEGGQHYERKNKTNNRTKTGPKTYIYLLRRYHLTIWQKVELDDAMIRLYNKSEGMVTQLEIVLNHSPRELQRALDLMHTQTEILKASFAAFKEA